MHWQMLTNRSLSKLKYHSQILLTSLSICYLKKKNNIFQGKKYWTYNHVLLIDKYH